MVQIGDCYVAVAGLPEPRRDHGPAMAVFAKEVLEKFEELVEKLEVELGPDTTELGKSNQMRFIDAEAQALANP